MKVFLTGASGFIGTNLLAVLRGEGHEVLNFDRVAPMMKGDCATWVEGDVMDSAGLAAAMKEFSPDWVVHMAARTDCDEETTVEKGYLINVEGTRHLLNAVDAAGSVKKLIVVSSQFVCRAGHMPAGDTDFNPETVYGESKARAEIVTRECDPDCTWTIVRPTNVWGPYHQRYAREFWHVLERGWYVHPDYPTPKRSYAFVGNVIWQMMRILEAPREKVHGRVFYLSDRPVDIIEWIRGFHAEITGRKKLRTVPYSLIRAIAKGGDAISRLKGKPFYITTSRLRSMTTDYVVPMERTFEEFGEPPYTLEEGIRETATWFKGRASQC